MQPEPVFSTKQIWLICRRGAPVLVALGVGSLLLGCGNVLYSYRANGAASTLEQAQKAGAERTALYEYTLASEYLRKAMSEASEADYGDACELAQQADGYAELALKKARWRQGTPRDAVQTLEATPPNAATMPSSGSSTGGVHR
ncbi:MAG TPA: DUF4398 domain-containing protein [Polyangiaceae bacterium]|nr:DUF4398 domain-containing protein [Polyangiaceae bacterium]